MSSKKMVVGSGKRKQAVARASIKPGKGNVRVNNYALDAIFSRYEKLRVIEPLILAGKHAKSVDIDVRVHGGGPTGQADACRLAIARVLVAKHPELKNVLLQYNRQLLVADVRRKEATKPNCCGRARAKRQKSYR